MSFKKIKFGDKEVDKKEFYSSKQAISLDSLDLDKIVVSNKWKINETTYKYLCGYLNNDVVQPLCVILPQMHGYIKYFNDGGKNMTYPRAYLEQCKYELKKRKIVNYTDDEIIDEDSDSDYNDTVDSHLNFSVPDSYVEI